VEHSVAWRQQQQFACGVIGLFALGIAIYSVRAGKVRVPLRAFNTEILRSKAPIRFWLIVFFYVGLACPLLFTAWFGDL
jgi:hypothetical protein